ncbi:MAG: class I SAM-dependent methyltransferase [Curvibacter sp.]
MADSSSNLYADKNAGYFAKARTEIEPLLPKRSERPLHVLEVGCAQGHTLEWLKTSGRCAWAAGVEPFAQVTVPAGVIDKFYRSNIEAELPDLEPASLDLILCLDVLEHLIDPWKTVERLDTLLRPGGSFIISVPNIRYYHILIDLAFKGRFEYDSEGILDRTHLRFFTRSSAIDLAECSGAKVQAVITPGLHRWQKRLMARLGLRDLLAKQLILHALKPENHI